MDLDPNDVLTSFMQIFGLTAAIIFGVFSVLSWSQAVKASYEAAAANVIAMVTLCSSQNGTDTEQLESLCLSITEAAQESLSAVASSLFPSQASTVSTVTATGFPSGAPITTSTPSTSHKTDTTDIVVGVVVSAFGLVSALVSALTYLGRSRSRR